MRFAQVIVIEGRDAGEVWEDLSATLGDNNNLLAKGHSCVFLSGPHEIADADDYDSLGVAQTIIRAELGPEAVPLDGVSGGSVHLVDVPLRPDGQYLFAGHGAAAAFADALSAPGEHSEVEVEDPPIYAGAAAEALIATERAALIEDLGLPTVAEDVRERKIGLETLLIRLAAIPDTTEARGLLGHWIEVDAGRTIAAHDRPFNLVSADSVGVGDWIALDVDGGPVEPRQVDSFHQSGVQLIFCFADEDPPAKFNFDELVWQRAAPHQARKAVG